MPYFREHRNPLIPEEFAKDQDPFYPLKRVAPHYLHQPRGGGGGFGAARGRNGLSPALRPSLRFTRRGARWKLVPSVPWACSRGITVGRRASARLGLEAVQRVHDLSSAQAGRSETNPHPAAANPVGAAAGVLRRSAGAWLFVRLEEAAAQVVGTCQGLCGQGRNV